MLLSRHTHKTYWQVLLMLAVILYAVTCATGVLNSIPTREILITWISMSLWLYLEVAVINLALTSLEEQSDSYPMWGVTVHVSSAIGCIALSVILAK